MYFSFFDCESRFEDDFFSCLRFQEKYIHVDFKVEKYLETCVGYLSRRGGGDCVLKFVSRWSRRRRRKKGTQYFLYSRFCLWALFMLNLVWERLSCSFLLLFFDSESNFEDLFFLLLSDFSKNKYLDLLWKNIVNIVWGYLS